MQTYTNNRAGFILGRYRAEGAQIEMTEAQARMYLLEKRISAKPRAKRATRKVSPTAASVTEEDDQ